ncbi:MAG: adenylate/guanylate cyclase domain-containing protein [Terrimicrobiaceae bacterium]
MRFQTKVFLYSLTIALLSSLLAAGFVYFPAQRLLFGFMQTNVLSIAATAASMLDAADHEKIRGREDQSGESYLRIEEKLRRARNANRRQDINVKFLYTMRPYPDNPAKAQFVVDAEERGEDKSNFGDIYKVDNPNYKFRINDFQVEEDFVRDQWGTWLTANAPVRDARGDAVAAVGVDVSADDALRRLHGLLWSAALALAVSLLFAWLFSRLLARRLAAPLKAIRATVEKISQGDFRQTLDLHTRDEFGEVVEALNEMSLGLQQRDDLKGALARYVSEDILQDVIYAGKSTELFSQRKKVTILFADVRGFTSMSEQSSPEETVAFLNQYFEKMIEAIFKNRGHLNKFMGDGLMALFGALRDDDYQEEHAVQAALDMRTVLTALKSQWAVSEDAATRNIASLEIGIGINTGLAIVGNIGSKQRMEFTAIGDAVNLASRLEQATRDRAGVDILVSEYTFVAARSRFPFEPVGEIPLKGKSEPVRTYTISEVFREVQS